MLFLGRGTGFPVALEGALKLKEISYIHAEGYAAGEMKHGPIALIDENLPVVVIAPQDAHYEKTLSNMQEVRAREGQVIAIATKGDEAVIARRIATRHEHFMPPNLLHSQFATLEEPTADEHPIVVSIEPPPREVVTKILTALSKQKVSQ